MKTSKVRMSPELEQILYSEFPMLYRLHHRDIPDMCCGWDGIECHDGWFELLRGISNDIVEYAKTNHLDPVVTRVSRFHGALRMQIDGGDNTLLMIIVKAIELSSRVCEICGAPGRYIPLAPYDMEVRCESHSIEKDRTPLSESEISALRRVNDQLRALTVEMKEEALRQVQILEGRVADSTDPVDDFCIDVEVKFILSDDDPEYREDDDNILASRSYLFGRKSAELWGDTRWEEQGRDFGVKNHCYLFHELYDHGYGSGQHKIGMRDILRIGDAWVDVVVRNQMYRKLGH